MLRQSFLYFSLFAVTRKVLLYEENFTVSSKAWNRIAEVNKTEGFSNAKRALRLAIESGGCHGYLYKFSFEELSNVDSQEDITLKPSDSVSFSDKSVEPSDSLPQLVVDKHSLKKLQNATIDFHSELKGSAFVVVGNELVDQSCACAMSFSIKKKKSAQSNRSGSHHSLSTENVPKAAGSTVRQATPISRR